MGGGAGGGGAPPAKKANSSRPPEEAAVGAAAAGTARAAGAPKKSAPGEAAAGPGCGFALLVVSPRKSKLSSPDGCGGGALRVANSRQKEYAEQPMRATHAPQLRLPW